MHIRMHVRKLSRDGLQPNKTVRVTFAKQQAHCRKAPACRWQPSYTVNTVCSCLCYQQQKILVHRLVHCQARKHDDDALVSQTTKRTRRQQQTQHSSKSGADSKKGRPRPAASKSLQPIAYEYNTTAGSYDRSQPSTTQSDSQLFTSDTKERSNEARQWGSLVNRTQGATSPSKRNFNNSQAAKQHTLNLSFKTTPNPAQLSRLITQCSTIDQLAIVLHSYHSNMDGINFSACLHRCATITASAQKRNTCPIQHISIHTDDLGSLPCIKMIDLQFDPGGRTDSMLSMSDNGSHYKQQGHGWNERRGNIKRLIGQLLALLSAHLEELHWRELSSALWSLATVVMMPSGQSGKDLFTKLLGHMEARGFETADSQSLSNTLWALGKLGLCPDQHWMNGCVQAVLTSAGMLEAQHVSNTLWGLAAIGYMPGRTWVQQFWQHVHNAMPNKQQLYFLYPNRSCQQLSGNQPAVQQQYLRPTKYQLVQMQQYANLLYALACLDYVPDDSSKSMLRFWNNTQALMLFELSAIQQEQSSAARLAQAPKEIVTTEGATDQTIYHMSAPNLMPTVDGSLQGNVWKPERLLPRHSVMLLLAISRLDIYPPVRWWNIFAQLLIQQIPTMMPQELSNTMYAYGKIASNNSQGRPGSLPNQTLAAVADSQHIHPHILSPQILQQLCSFALRKRRGMTAQGIANILWAVARLHVMETRKQRQPSRILKVSKHTGTGTTPTALPAGINRGWGTRMVQAVCQNLNVTVSKSSTQQYQAAQPVHTVQRQQQQQQQQQPQRQQQHRAWQRLSPSQGTNKLAREQRDAALQQLPSNVAGENALQNNDSGATTDIEQATTRRVDWNMIGPQGQQSDIQSKGSKGRTGPCLMSSSVTQNTHSTSVLVDGKLMALQPKDVQGVSPQVIGNIIWAVGVLNIDPGAQSMRTLLQQLDALIQNGVDINPAVKQQLLRGCAKLRYSHFLEQYVPSVLQTDVKQR